MKSELPRSCVPHVQKSGASVCLSSLAQVVSGKSAPAILGANESVCGFSLFAAEPLEVFEFSLTQTDPFAQLSSFFSRYQLSQGGSDAIAPGMFCGGWIGFFGYELGRFIERLPARAADDLKFPVIRLGFYDKAILYDHAAQCFRLVAVDCGDGVNEKFSVLRQWLQTAGEQPVEPPVCSGDRPVRIDCCDCSMTQSQYFDALAKTHQFILDGEVYQINFSQRFGIDFSGRAMDLFHWQNRFNPSPYAGYLAWDDRAIVSASPELFLQVRGDHIETQPIKGTRPRNRFLPDDAAENQMQLNDLRDSEKDQAELAMIVDLQRNDLAKICVPGTRHVSCLRAIETFPTVYHAIGTVEGTLVSPPGPQRVIDLLRATFPGGSITGAPKIRAMEIIDALEPTARGVYTGSIGWIGLNFDLCWNIAIRTILLSGGKAYVQTGGGIVADSDPQAEWDETLTKAAALLAGIQAVSHPARVG